MSMNILENESMEVYTCILPYSCTVILTYIYIYCMARIVHIKVGALTVSMPREWLNVYSMLHEYSQQ